jgi:hypothetical protein
MLVLTYNFATTITANTTLNLYTLTTIFQLVSKLQNCELKQEPCTLSTELQQTHEFQHRERKHFFTPEMWGRNCSEFVASGDTFVLTLNRASALKVEDSEQNFLLRLHIVANTARIGLESKLHRVKTSPHQNFIRESKCKNIICFLPESIYHI